MKQQINMDLLKQSDEVTEEHIAEEFPYPLKKTETFEKAYQNYLKQSDQMEDRSLTNRSRRRRLYRVGSLVACLLMTVGLGVSVGSRLQRIDTRPSNNTETFTTTVTEENLSQTSPCLVATDDSHKSDSTTHTAPTLSTTTTLQTANNIGCFETQDESEPNKKDAIPNTTISDLGESTLSGISDVVTTTFLPKSEPVYSDMVSTTLPQKSDIVYTETSPIDTAISASTGAIESTDEVGLTKPVDTSISSETTSTETIVSSDTIYEILPGFSVTDFDGFLEIIYQNEIIDSPEGLWMYNFETDTFKVTSTMEAGNNLRTYWVHWEESSPPIRVNQLWRTQFRTVCDTGDRLQLADLNEKPGYFVMKGDAEKCFLYWDDGHYSFVIEDKVCNIDVMLDIAKGFNVSSQSSNQVLE